MDKAGKLDAVIENCPQPDGPELKRGARCSTRASLPRPLNDFQ
jgi:hypothetical protein